MFGFGTTEKLTKSGGEPVASPAGAPAEQKKFTLNKTEASPTKTAEPAKPAEVPPEVMKIINSSEANRKIWDDAKTPEAKAAIIQKVMKALQNKGGK